MIMRSANDAGSLVSAAARRTSGQVDGAGSLWGDLGGGLTYR